MLSETLNLENLTMLRPSAIQAPTVGLLMTAPATTSDVASIRSTVTDDRRLLITLGVQLCVQRDGRLGAATGTREPGRKEVPVV